MDKVQKQRSNIVLYREKKDGEHYIRIEYAGDPAIALLLAQDTDVEKTDNGSAYMTAAAFKLPDFYDRYSPHAYIDYSRVYVRHPKPQRTYVLPEGYLELLEQKRYSPSTVKTYRAYFSDFMEYHKGRSIDRLKVADVNDITRISIKSIRIFCIWMYVFLSGVHLYASNTADSVYFHVQLDTLGGLRVGQVLKLTYALANSQFDLVSSPVFNHSIEVVSGPKPHKSESYALVNGVGHKSHETGFYYFVRFRESGEIQLPVASVKVGNQIYTTSECRVTVHPSKVDVSKLKCNLKVEQLKGDYAKYRASLTCNARPDQNPPLLSINGKVTRPTSNSYSGSNDKEEYVYNYYFSSEGYEVSCKELTFGGIPYSVKTKKNKIDETDFLIIILIVLALFELIWWLVGRHRYRQEQEAALAEFVLENRTLPLNTSWAYTHYGLSHTLLLFSVLSFSTICVKLYASEVFITLFLWIGILLVPLAYLSYRNQRRKLNFESTPTTLDKQAIYDKICKLADYYDWDIDHCGDDCIVAHTNPAIWHLTWGEQIFIVFDKGQVWINSVNDLNKRTSPFSFGYAKRNIRRIREALTQDVTIRD